MKTLDRLLQHWRISKAKKYIPKGSMVLDIGCADAILYRSVPGITNYVGIDFNVAAQRIGNNFRIINGTFPRDLPPELGKFGTIVMLAIVEHIPESDYDVMAQRCFDTLNPGGKLIITVPEPFVDTILHLLQGWHLIDCHELGLNEHHAFDTRKVSPIFSRAGLRQHHHSKFQLGLNNLFVFERPVLA